MQIVISRPGSKVRMRQGRLLLEYDDEVFQTYPLNHIEALVCVTGVYVTEPVLSNITQRGGSILYVKRSGKLKYITQPLRSILTVKARFRQYKIIENHNHLLALSKKIVRAKVQNGIRFLSEKNNYTNNRNMQELKNIRGNISRVLDLQQLRGLEGIAAQRYFYLLRGILPDITGFKRRIKRKKPDIVNMSMDFLYSMLYHATFSAIMATGLDPYMGFYHTTAYGHAALSSDIMEPYRSQIADRVLLRSLNDPVYKKILAQNKHPEKLNKDIIVNGKKPMGGIL